MSTSSTLGPVSAALEAELRTRVRQQGLLIWLDLDGHYTAFVDRLMAARAQGDLPYEVLGFRGSHLALMLALEGKAGGVERPQLVIHLPGFNEETVAQTPMLELYRAGVRHRKALPTLITEAAGGRVPPSEIEALLAQDGLTLEAADAWLEAQTAGAGEGVAGQLAGRAIEAVLDELLTSGPLAQRLGAPGVREAFWARLAAGLGLPDRWQRLAAPQGAARPEDVAYVAASWALCVEYVDDLSRAPVSPHLAALPSLMKPLVEACRGVAAHLRARHKAVYQRTADEVALILHDEVAAARAEDLGRVDTFRFEEEKVFEAALVALRAQRFDTAARWAEERLSPKGSAPSFWLKAQPELHQAWTLVQAGAQLGQAILRAGSELGAKTVDAAVEAYVARGAAVDQAHRHLEQRRLALLFGQRQRFEPLRVALDGLRASWRAWADAWALDFSRLCRTQGFLPQASLQQRGVFEEVVRPMTQEAGTTAYFVVDALRYEMGEALSRLMADNHATTVQLRARLAELPTLTKVGMNALAPVAREGRLHPAMKDGEVLGFSTGEFRVVSPETRCRAMHDRVGGGTCPLMSLDEVVGRDTTSLRRGLGQARLVVVHTQEIDETGEAGAGPATFEVLLQKVRTAWRLLREAGVRRFVITSDHGFLLLDEQVKAAQAHGRKVDPRRRHVFSEVAADHTGEVRVALSALGYEGATGHVMFPESTAVFDTGRHSAAFVHGGNSLQERVIPVLTVVHRGAAGGSVARYAVTAEASAPVAGMHCLSGRVDSVVAQGALDFGGPKSLELALQVVELEGVQVELCQARGAELRGAGLVAPVGAPFELFFRLSGAVDARVQVQLHHPGASAEVTPGGPEARFAVMAVGVKLEAKEEKSAQVAEGWVAALPEGGVRQAFLHLAAHGVLTEVELSGMVGGQRGARRFAREFDGYAQRAPFGVRVEVVGNVKRYVREGRA